MCGIAGLFHFDGTPADASVLDRMRRATVHRGPDDHGLYTKGHVGLAHNRLSILDLSPKGHQPMVDAESGCLIVYNGEIYNFREIRAELESLGYTFQSTGDTEVILRAYSRWGPACVEKFRGMFAFAIYNPREDELFLVRDRLGIKPLYYYRDNKRFLFASETKSIVLVEGVPRQLNAEALPEYAAFRYVTNGRTLLKDIYELQPGHCMTVSRRGVSMRQYWDIPFHPENGRSETEWLDELQAELKRSVAYRLISDVPVGCALSGGVDSSLVTALACEVATSTMKTFSIGFNGLSDERVYARRVSESLKVENFTDVLEDDTFYQYLSKLTWHMDEPMNHPNSVAMWQLSKLARPRVTVLLSGEGGDEVMGGYDRFMRVLQYRMLSRTPGSRWMTRIASPFMGSQASRIARELARDDDGRMIWSSAYLPSTFLEPLFGKGAVERAEAARRSILAHAPADDLINRHLYYELKTYLVSILTRNDKMTMAVSLENRVPLLDHKVVELAGRMPTTLKVSRRQGKIALFRLVARYLSPELFKRPKVGFGLPPAYFQGENLSRLKDIILSRSFRERGWMNESAVWQAIEHHAVQAESIPESIWAFAALELWARTFIDRPGEVAT